MTRALLRYYEGSEHDGWRAECVELDLNASGNTAFEAMTTMAHAIVYRGDLWKPRVDQAQFVADWAASQVTMELLDGSPFNGVPGPRFALFPSQTRLPRPGGPALVLRERATFVTQFTGPDVAAQGRTVQEAVDRADRTMDVELQENRGPIPAAPGEFQDRYERAVVALLDKDGRELFVRLDRSA